MIKLDNMVNWNEAVATRTLGVTLLRFDAGSSASSSRNDRAYTIDLVLAGIPRGKVH